MNDRARVLDFFRQAGVRVSVARATISRMLQLAYPTLDLILADLEAAGELERNTMMDDQWRPTRGFIFYDRESAKQLLERKMLAELEQRAQYNERVKKRDAEMSERTRALREEHERVKAARTAARREKLEAHRLEREARAIAAVRARAEKKEDLRAVMNPAPMTVEVVETSPLENDPWKRVRERHYAKPPLLSSSLRALTPEELMRGRARRRA